MFLTTACPSSCFSSCFSPAGRWPGAGQGPGVAWGRPGSPFSATRRPAGWAESWRCPGTPWSSSAWWARGGTCRSGYSCGHDNNGVNRRNVWICTRQHRNQQEERVDMHTTTSESTGGRWRVWTRQHRSQPGGGGGCGHDNIGVNRGEVAGVDTTIRAPVVLDVDMDATTVRSAEGTCNSRCSWWRQLVGF